uniref:Uncharacterized protein n=1 Tax=Anguilla anguilla TaxID=7936 RepID=A0A0E9QI70_ANGAN
MGPFHSIPTPKCFGCSPQVGSH